MPLSPHKIFFKLDARRVLLRPILVPKSHVLQFLVNGIFILATHTLFLHRCLQSFVDTRARLGYTAFDAQLQKAYFCYSSLHCMLYVYVSSCVSTHMLYWRSLRLVLVILSHPCPSPCTLEVLVLFISPWHLTPTQLSLTINPVFKDLTISTHRNVITRSPSLLAEKASHDVSECRNETSNPVNYMYLSG